MLHQQIREKTVFRYGTSWHHVHVIQARAESASAPDFTPVASLRYTAGRAGTLAGLELISTVIFRWVDENRCLTGADAGHSRCSLRLCRLQ